MAKNKYWIPIDLLVLTIVLLIFLFASCFWSDIKMPDTLSTNTIAGNNLVDSLQPPTARIDTVDLIFNERIEDPYRWLEDGRNAEVIKWVDAQNEYARSVLSISGRSELEEKFSKLLRIEESSAPFIKGNRMFFWTKKSNQEKAVYYWKDIGSNKKNILIDSNTFSAEKNYSIGNIYPSNDGKLVIFTVNKNNADLKDIKVLDVDSNKIYESDTIHNLLLGKAFWDASNRGFYYIGDPADLSMTPGERNLKMEIRYHKLNTEPAQDKVIFRANDYVWLSLWVSDDGKMLLVHAFVSVTQTDIIYIDLEQKDSEPSFLVKGRKGLFIATYYDKNFYIMNNESSSKFSVHKASVTGNKNGKWEKIITDRNDAIINNIDIVGGKIALTVLKNASSALEVYQLDGHYLYSVKLPCMGTVSKLVGCSLSDVFYFTFESYNYPKEIIMANIKTGETDTYFRPNVGIDHGSIQIDQVFYKSKDGTTIPMFLAYKKGKTAYRHVPTLLNAYGASNIPYTPYFSPRQYIWIERGGIAAYANVRGGGDFGTEWYELGSRSKKQNTFDDVIAAAEYLVKENYTLPERLGLCGGSSGGLMAGAVMAQRPDLFRAVWLQVPMLDMVRYTKSGAGAAWIDEFGDPAKPDDFKWLYKYSPYHNIKKGVNYPALLVVSSDSDDRVDPLHARKFVAKTQWAQTANRPVLLRTSKNAGHTGADQRSASISESVDILVFLCSQLSLEESR